MEKCIEKVKTWMSTNRLQLNEDKTEVLLCDPKNHLVSMSDRFLTIDNTIISFSSNAKNLGVYFDPMLCMSHHLDHLCKVLNFELRQISQLSSLLDKNSLQTLVSAFLFSRLDYCNLLFYGLPDSSLDRLQKIQNHAAKVVLKKKKSDHVTPLLFELHWLPVKQRITYKIAVMCFKFFNGTAPPYFSELINPYVSSRNLRSSAQVLLDTPRKGSKRLGDRAFRHAAPYVWNSLPPYVRNYCSKSEITFKKHLESHLITHPTS